MSTNFFVSAIVFSTLFACNTGKEATEVDLKSDDPSVSVSGPDEFAKVDAGRGAPAGDYKKATVTARGKTAGCPFVLKVRTEDTLLDPINHEDFQWADGDEVYVSYRKLRIPNRCDDALPVEITGVVE